MLSSGPSRYNPKNVTHRSGQFLPVIAVVLLTSISLPSQVPSVQVQPSVPAAPRPAPAFYRNLIVLDPAHGGRDAGAQLSNNAAEKDVTLAFAQRLRPALAAQGFVVAATRDSDPPDELTSDQRAGTANHNRPLACILLHATPTGTGVHIVTSALPPSETNSRPGRALPWNVAQAATLPISFRLANEIGLALEAAHLSPLLLKASVPPIDNLICPAIAVELSPLERSSSSATPATDATYQQRAADAIAIGLASFRAHNAPGPTGTPAPGAHAGATP